MSVNNSHSGVSMRLLLLNNNLAVSRLIKLSAEKAGYELDEFEDYGLVPLTNYDIILIDNELFDESALTGLREYTGCNYVVYICQRGSKKPETVNVVLEKPFLPTDFLILLEKLKTVIESHKAEEENAEDFSMQMPSETTDEQPEAFDIDQIDTLEDEDNMLPINLLEENEDDFEEDEKSEKLSFDDLELDDLSLDDESSEGKIPEEKELSGDDEFSFDDITSLAKEDDVATPFDEFDFEEEKNASLPSMDQENTDSDVIEEEMHNPSVLDKDDIDEVKQLLDESEEEEDEKEIDELSLEALNVEKDDLGTFFLDEEEKEEEPFVKEDESLSLDFDDASDLTFEDIPDEEETLAEESLTVDEEAEDQEEIINDFTEEIDEKIEEEKEQALEEEEELLPNVNVAIDAFDEMEEDIDSLDDLNENMLKQAFGEDIDIEEETLAPVSVSAQKNQDIEVIRDELENSIARSISSLAQSGILREALKGMRLNISITFDEKE